jgi:predicted nucleic acid-binding protein
MPDSRPVKPLFVDTGPFYAQFVATATRHDRARRVFDGIATGDLPYRPLFTSTYVLDELATLVLSHRDHAAAVEALDRIVGSPATVISPEETDFEATREQFTRYENPDISFTDHMSYHLANDRGIEHVFSFDPDHFRTLGLTVVPGDTGET